MSTLFEAATFKDVTLRNRIAIPPMCQYSATDGVVNEWHQVHYPALARGGAGLVIVEATGVTPEGRITPGCTGLWNDGQAEGLAGIASAIRREGAVPGIQLGHAGRKASANRPWEGDDHIPVGDPRAWETISPSAIAFGGLLPRVPREMTIAEIERVRGDFVAATIRARDAGFEWLELHFAHGYLGQSFFSVHANRRIDAYGGDWAGRARFLLETLEAVRKVWPERLPLTARLGVVEFDGRDEETLADSIALARAMRERGLDMLSVSIGFSTIEGKTPWAPGFMAPITRRVREEAGIATATAWGMDGPEEAQRAVAAGDMDLVMIGRAHLADPHYPYAMAQALGTEAPAWATLPPPYAHWLARYAGPGRSSAQ